MVSILSITNFDNLLQEGNILPEVLFARIIDFLICDVKLFAFQQYCNIKLTYFGVRNIETYFATFYGTLNNIFYVIVIMKIDYENILT